MFSATQRLPHLLPPSAYGAAEHYQREGERLRVPSWHVVGLNDRVPESKPFVPIVRRVGRKGALPNHARRMLARSWGWLAAQVTRRRVAEDLTRFALIQRGLEASPHLGILGRCEDRIHAFQAFIDRELRRD